MDYKGKDFYGLFMLDSGVYVLNMLYRKEKLKDFSYKKTSETYSNFLKEYCDNFDYYANFDCCF